MEALRIVETFVSLAEHGKLVSIARDNTNDFNKEIGNEFVIERLAARYNRLYPSLEYSSAFFLSKILIFSGSWSKSGKPYLYGGLEGNEDSFFGYEPIRPAWWHDKERSEEEIALLEQLNWFDKQQLNADAFYGCFKFAPEQAPVELFFYDNADVYALDLDFQGYYEALLSMVGVAGWQYFFVDPAEIVRQNINVPSAGNFFFPNVRGKKSRLEAIQAYMAILMDWMPKMFPSLDFSWANERLAQLTALIGTAPQVPENCLFINSREKDSWEKIEEDIPKANRSEDFEDLLGRMGEIL